MAADCTTSLLDFISVLGLPLVAMIKQQWALSESKCIASQVELVELCHKDVPIHASTPSCRRSGPSRGAQIPFHRLQSDAALHAADSQVAQLRQRDTFNRPASITWEPKANISHLTLKPHIHAKHSGWGSHLCSKTSVFDACLRNL